MPAFRNMVKERTDDFHLLLTDVILPEMNGKELAGPLSLGIPAIDSSAHRSSFLQ